MSYTFFRCLKIWVPQVLYIYIYIIYFFHSFGKGACSLFWSTLRKINGLVSQIWFQSNRIFYQMIMSLFQIMGTIVFEYTSLRLTTCRLLIQPGYRLCPCLQRGNLLLLLQGHSNWPNAVSFQEQCFLARDGQQRRGWYVSWKGNTISYEPDHDDCFLVVLT